MRIKIEDIKQTGSTLTFVKEIDWLDELLGDLKARDFSFSKPMILNVTINKSHKDIVIRGKIRTEVRLSCARCLEPFAYAVDTDMDISFIPSSEQSRQADVTYDLEFYDGETIDLSKGVRDQILLSMPIKSLCKESCKGLCPKCGANLNKESCQCNKVAFDSRFEVLRQLIK
jgi:uncharacterized protein